MSREIVKSSGYVIGRPGPGEVAMWGLAIPIGAGVGLLVWLFGILASYLQFLAYGAAAGRLASRAADLAWWSLLIGPLVGGALTALLLRAGVSTRRGLRPPPYGLQDVLMNRRLRNTIQSSTLSLKDSFLSSAIGLVSSGWGGSTGREEPLAHLGASIGILHGRLLGLDIAARRLLLAMGFAAAIAASLHTPMAAVLLTAEIILRRGQYSTLGPVVVAAVSGWLASGWLSGGRPLLDLPDTGYLPAGAHALALFCLPLLIMSGYAAHWIWARTPRVADAAANRLNIPLWTMPAIGGLLLGLQAVATPHVLGNGFDQITAAATGSVGADVMLALAAAKLVAAATLLCFSWGGGAIAPAMVIGARAGASLALTAGAISGVSPSPVYLSVIGMSVCLAILLDAPLAAGVMAMELSGSPETGAASCLACFAAYIVVRRLPPVVSARTDKAPRGR